MTLPEGITPDQGAYGNTTAEAVLTVVPRIALRTPDLYTDWERAKPHSIRWETYGNTADAPVRIDLYQDTAEGPQAITTLAATTPDDGEFTWTPANNTGKTSDAPKPNPVKPNPVNLLRIYTLGPTHTLYVDSGTYGLFYPIVLSGTGTRSDDEGFVFTGPSGAGQTATFRHAHPATVAPLVELCLLDAHSAVRVPVLRGQLQSALASYDERTTLASAAPLAFEYVPGFADLGAYEFQGSSFDVTPPSVTRSEVLRSGTAEAPQLQVHVTFSEAVDPIDARAPANYDFREAGPNGAMGEADDIRFEVVPQYEAGSLLVILDVVAPDPAAVARGKFELTVHGDSTIHDLSGLKLDGCHPHFDGQSASIALRQMLGHVFHMAKRIGR